MGNSPQGKQPEVFRPYVDNPSDAFRPPPMLEDTSRATFFLDTNALFAPYRSTEATFAAIIAVYSRLRGEGRLMIPATVAREFAAGRVAEITKLRNTVSGARSAEFPRLKPPAIVGGLPAFAAVRSALESIDSAKKSYHKALDALIASIDSWLTKDPVLAEYQKLFGPTQVIECEMAGAEFKTLRDARYEANMPPGFEDKAKSNGGGGDLAIWLTLLSHCQKTKVDAVLVTDDAKKDWLHSAGNPRFELLEEFRARVSEHSCTIIPLAEFLRINGAPGDAVEEVAKRDVTDFYVDEAADYLQTRLAEFALGDITRLGRDMLLVHTDDAARPVCLWVVPAASPPYGGRRDLEQGMDAAHHYSSSKAVDVTLVFLVNDDATARRIKSKFPAHAVRGAVSPMILQDCGDFYICWLNQSQSAEVVAAFPVGV